MPHCKPSQPASSTRSAPISPMLKGTSHPGANSWPRPQAHPPSPAASQPLVKELWLGLGHLPCNAGATGIEMAALFVHMPGDCPVKQSKSQRLLRSKKEREKKKHKFYRCPVLLLGNSRIQFLKGGDHFFGRIEKYICGKHYFDTPKHTLKVPLCKRPRAPTLIFVPVSPPGIYSKPWYPRTPP